jgi:hypothetical protein
MHEGHDAIDGELLRTGPAKLSLSGEGQHEAGRTPTCKKTSVPAIGPRSP